MQNLKRRNFILNTTQIIVWVGVFLVPALVTWTTTGHMQQAFFVFRHTARMVLPLSKGGIATVIETLAWQAGQTSEPSGMCVPQVGQIT